MSMTTDRATASAYSGEAKDRGTVLEIAAGQVDKGASISFLSQYPGEAEFLMPPLSCLEVLYYHWSHPPPEPLHPVTRYPPSLPGPPRKITTELRALRVPGR
jgi:hypothetical protein